MHVQLRVLGANVNKVALTFLESSIVGGVVLMCRERYVCAHAFPFTKLMQQYCHFYYDHSVFFVNCCNDGCYTDSGCIEKHL
jgi:hypothetical protein